MKCNGYFHRGLLAAAATTGLLLAACCATTHAAPVAPPVPATAWLLDEGTGTDLFEWHGSGPGTGQIALASGAAVPMPAWSTDTPFNYPGDYSLEFTGTGSGVPAGYARVDGHTSATKGTISFWVANDGTGMYILDATNGSRTLMYRTGGWGTYLNQSYLGDIGSDLIPADSQWTHVALVWDNSLATDKEKIYKNGTLFDTRDISIGARYPADVFLGSRFNLAEGWGGKIDEYALWNTPLSADQVQWLATNSVSKIPTKLPHAPVRAWLFDEGSGATAKARWGGDDGTLQANVTRTTDTPFAYEGNHALVFDGSDPANAVTFPGQTFGTEGTISVWAYRQGGAQYLFDASPGGRTLLYAHYELYMNDTHLGAINGELIPDNEWTHLVITWDNDGTDGMREKIYKNGSLFTTFDTVLNPRSPAMLWLGNRYSNNEPWRGLIDEYALWNTALSPQEIGWLYQHSLIAIPEPATFVLLGLGGVCMLGYGRRRRRRRCAAQHSAIW
jgi:hypothetical protein